MNKLRLVVNLLSFNLGWFAAVYSASLGREELGGVAILALVAIHLSLSPAEVRFREFLVLVVCGVFGVVFETLIYKSGSLVPAESEAHLLFGLAPIFLIIMWINFGTALLVTFKFLWNRLAMGALIGFFSAPLTYYAGVRLGAADFGDLGWRYSALVIGLVWAISFPALLKITPMVVGRR